MSAGNQGSASTISESSMEEVAKREVKVLKPCPFDLDDLARSTESAFGVLRPWSQRKHSTEALQKVTSQVDTYVEALNHSISAAYHGFVVAGQALALACLLDHGTEEEREQYMLDMMCSAMKGHKSALEALAGFRGVRTTLGLIIGEASAKASKDPTQPPESESTMMAELLLLEGGISVLERFAASVGNYALWWNFMAMENGAMTDRTMSFNYNSLRAKGVVLQWEAIKKDYSLYTEKIGALQDAHPELRRGDLWATYYTAMDSSGTTFAANNRAATPEDYTEVTCTCTPRPISRWLQQFIRNTFRRGTSAGQATILH